MKINYIKFDDPGYFEILENHNNNVVVVVERENGRKDYFLAGQKSSCSEEQFYIGFGKSHLLAFL